MFCSQILALQIKTKYRFLLITPQVIKLYTFFANLLQPTWTHHLGKGIENFAT